LVFRDSGFPRVQIVRDATFPIRTVTGADERKVKVSLPLRQNQMFFCEKSFGDYA
jgi:hypothetical protein